MRNDVFYTVIGTVNASTFGTKIVQSAMRDGALTVQVYHRLDQTVQSGSRRHSVSQVQSVSQMAECLQVCHVLQIISNKRSVVGAPLMGRKRREY